MGGFHRGVLLATGRGRAEAIENLFNNRGGWLSQEAMVVTKPDKDKVYIKSTELHGVGKEKRKHQSG